MTPYFDVQEYTVQTKVSKNRPTLKVGRRHRVCFSSILFALYYFLESKKLKLPAPGTGCSAVPNIKDALIFYSQNTCCVQDSVPDPYFLGLPQRIMASQIHSRSVSQKNGSGSFSFLEKVLSGLNKIMLAILYFKTQICLLKI